MPFCADPGEQSRSKLWAPFSQGGHSYATNGHVMVRVARRADVPQVEGLPDNAPAIFELRASAELTPFGGLLLPAPEICAPNENCDRRAIRCDSCATIGLRGRIYRLAYVRQVTALPDLRLERAAQPVPDIWPRYGRPELALRFAFGGADPGEGLLMPMVSQSGRHLDLLEGDLVGAHGKEGAA